MITSIWWLLVIPSPPSLSILLHSSSRKRSNSWTVAMEHRDYCKRRWGIRRISGSLESNEKCDVQTNFGMHAKVLQWNCSLKRTIGLRHIRGKGWIRDCTERSIRSITTSEFSILIYISQSNEWFQIVRLSLLMSIFSLRPQFIQSIFISVLATCCLHKLLCFCFEKNGPN